MCVEVCVHMYVHTVCVKCVCISVNVCMYVCPCVLVSDTVIIRMLYICVPNSYLKVTVMNEVYIVSEAKPSVFYSFPFNLFRCLVVLLSTWRASVHGCLGYSISAPSVTPWQ